LPAFCRSARRVRRRATFTERPSGLGAPTYDDLVALAEHVVGELIAGELHVSPRAAIPHAVAASALDATLLTRMQFGDGGPGGWWILDEPELHLAEDVVVPELAGWRRERLTAAPREGFLTLAPDWVCGPLSHATSRVDRSKKLPLYAGARIQHLCLLDPLNETLEIDRHEGEYWVLLATYDHGSAHSRAARKRPRPKWLP
jgi:hypothetical protein